ncbi:MAG: succinate dehydrogenase assembly factor 2 [Candidatus Zeuxoniibacter abyssi]|nr:MAG: succinate dehydrogenase assembly factor 2 [Candidatus Persebacteraceae bacterium AB1(2)]
MKDAERCLRWQSRRGLLELDLLLEKFWQEHGGDLSEQETQRLSDILSLSDDELWRLLKKPPNNDDALTGKLKGKGGAECHKH